MGDSIGGIRPDPPNPPFWKGEFRLDGGWLVLVPRPQPTGHVIAKRNLDQVVLAWSISEGGKRP